jgi:ATP-dependent DNA helicase RecQ
MEYLRRELDDEGAAPCGRCDNCTGRHWGPAGAGTGQAADTEAARAEAARAEAAREQLLRPGVPVEPRKMWPAGMKELGITGASGKIAASLLAEPGRALGRLTDIGWGTTLRSVLSPEAADQPVPDQVFDGVVKVLAAWDWAQRPAGVVTLPSNSRPELIGGLGQRIAAIGRLPYLGSLEYAGAGEGPGARRHNSAQRVRSLWDAFTVPASLREAVGGVGGPVLLVDDRIETGWTMTVAAKLLREAGAPAVLPLVLAVTTG